MSMTDEKLPVDAGFEVLVPIDKATIPEGLERHVCAFDGVTHVPQWLANAVAALRPDTARLDWLLDDLGIDEMGGVDIHEMAYTLLHDTGHPSTTNREAYAAAYRLAIDAAMKGEQDEHIF